MYENSQAARDEVKACRRLLGTSTRPINERYEVIKVEGQYQFALVDSETLDGVFSDDQDILERFAATLNNAHVQAVRQGAV